MHSFLVLEVSQFKDKAQTGSLERLLIAGLSDGRAWGWELAKLEGMCFFLSDVLSLIGPVSPWFSGADFHFLALSFALRSKKTSGIGQGDW